MLTHTKNSGVISLFILLLAIGQSNGANKTGHANKHEIISEIKVKYNWPTINEEKYLAPSLYNLSYKVTTYQGVETSFLFGASEGSSPIVRYAWDFESDGIIDWESSFCTGVSHIYSSVGSYHATIYAFDVLGRYEFAQVPVQVLSGEGLTKIESNLLKLTYTGLKNRKMGDERASLEDSTIRYFLLVADNNDAYWLNVRNTYKRLVDSFGYSEVNLLVCSGPQNGNYSGYSFPQDTVIIDYSYTPSGVDSALNFLLGIMTSNDDLHVFSEAHGTGYYTEDAATYGDTTEGGMPFRIGTVVGFTTDTTDPDIDQIESEFKIRYGNNIGYRKTGVGLNEWWGYWGINNLVLRRKYVATFNNMQFYGDPSPTSDTDIYVETIGQYLKGDINHNMILDSGEAWNWDNDSNPPIDTTPGGYIYDDGDWGDYFLAENLQHGQYPSPYPSSLFYIDSGFDGILEVSYNGSNFESPTVCGTDWDNDGLIIGLDFNNDGDKLDSVGVSETGFTGLDNNISDFLDSLEFRHATFILLNCYSGGFIKDLSRENVIIATAAPEGTVSWGHRLTSSMGLTLTGEYSPKSDLIVTLKEAFNAYATSTNPVPDGRERFDDNGDKIGHVFPLPNSGDGYLADSLSWGTLSLPAPIPIPISPVDYDSVYDDVTPTFVWSDTGNADSFQVAVNWSGGCTGGELYSWTTDTTYTIPTCNFLNIIPNPEYKWYVRSHRGLVPSDWSECRTLAVLASPTCCINNTGNVNGDANDVANVLDLNMLINFIFRGVCIDFICYHEADVEPSEIVVPNIVDLNRLKAYIYQGVELPNCP